MNWRRVYKALTHPSDLLIYLIQSYGNIKRMEDERYLRLIYFIKFHHSLNLKNPLTFNEKLQWLKLNDHNPNYPKMVDKITAKEYVAAVIGEKYIIPTLAVYESLDSIDVNHLPNQFVLKTNHSGGNTGVVICKDKSLFDIDAAKIKLKKSLESDMFCRSREWPYKQIRPKVFLEKYLCETDLQGLIDYKFFCFNGVVNALFVGTERDTGNVKFDFFDADFNHLDIVQTHPMSGKKIERPKNFEKMKELASMLSKGIPHVRIDMYNISGKIYFGEMTFYHHSGFEPFHPSHWDRDFGKWIKLN